MNLVHQNIDARAPRTPATTSNASDLYQHPIELVIERHNGFWCVVNLCHIGAYLATQFQDHADPWNVSLMLKHSVNGPITVIWNL